MSRLAHIAAVFCELAALVLLGVAMGAGRLDQGWSFHGPVFGALLLLAMLTGTVLPRQMLRSACVHGLLVLGAVLFTLPFAWLLVTSFKYPEEVAAYPPRWVPAVPGATTRSPFVNAELFDDWRVPDALAPERWETLRPRAEAVLWEAGRALLGPDRVRGLADRELRPVLTRALWQATSLSVPLDIWEKADTVILGALRARVDSERMEQVWNLVFRCVALRAPSFADIERREYPLDATRPFEAYATPIGAARLAARPVSLLPDAAPFLLLEYDMSTEPEAGFRAELPLPMPPEQLLSVTVPLRQDRSWHRLRVELELGGRRYVSDARLYLGLYRWQELSFKIAERDARDERDVGIWPLAAARDQQNAFNEPGRCRLTVRLHRASAFAALWNKYTQNYRDAWVAGKHWDSYIFNSGYLVGFNVLGQIIACSLVAYAFARLRWPGRDALFFIMLATMMLPPQVTMIPVFLVFKELGWYNTLKPLWAPAFTGAAFFIFLLRQFMMGIPRDLEDAARIDGCGFYETYGRIILPLVKPALAAVGIFTFMNTWNDFMGPLIYVSDQRLYPLALGLFDFRQEHGAEFGMLMAASTLMILPVVILFFFAQRYFIQGVTLTGMKN
ncbi:MAG: ABC transporter permease subunit [Candidatus Hydrogenedentes bacterium]|nr:ABC transporter permease subunit [Candidatus Hydrogenedentota bacterium]